MCYKGRPTAKIRRSWAIGGYSPGWEVHFGDFAVLGERKLAIFIFQVVDVDGAIRRLCSNIFVEGIPGHALDVVVMLGNLAYNCS
jgi:hypothetical protein